MDNIYRNYLNLCDTPSDINEHLPTIKRYAEECKHITEFGVRDVVSTWAFLAAKPEKLVSIDINECPIQYAAAEASKNNILFEFIKADTGSNFLNIEETDLLFIDTWHIYGHLKKELNLHAGKSRKYIILHDTTTFGLIPENPSPELGEEYTIGLWLAITEFLVYNPQWDLLEKYENNNGLTILKRKY